MKDSMKKTYDGLYKWFVSTIENDVPFSFGLKSVKGLNGAKSTRTTDFSQIKKRLQMCTVTGTDADGNKTLTAVYADEPSHLSIRLDAIFYKDVPTLDYVVKLTNISDTECTPVITDVAALDADYPLVSDGKYMLENANGSLAKNEDFEQKNYELTDKLTFAEIYGRSSDGAWPYFAVDGKENGFLLAIGWSGNWRADFENKENAVGIKVCFDGFSSYLRPHESIRSHRIVLVANEKDNEYGHNVFRRTIVKHYTPYCKKKKEFVPPISMNFWGGRNTAFITKVVKLYADAGIKADNIWMDAAWYGNFPFMGEDKSIGWNAQSGGGWSSQLGVWEDNRNLYPNGIKEVCDYVHENSPYKVLLWWMLEDGRVNPFKVTYEVGNGEKRTVEMDVLNRQTFGKESYYKELVSVPDGRSILKLSDDKVFTKVLNYFRNKFSNDNVDWMRIDYYSRPQIAWDAHDIEEATALAGEKFAQYRKGYTENRYVTNLYRFFDTMYEEYPDWLLDNCASGGRRLDIEMASRGIPLWRTDYNDGSKPDYCEANQVQTEYLSRWLPFTGIGVSRPADAKKYYQRSFFCAGPCINTGKYDAAALARMKELVDEYVLIRPFWSGDYYQLLPVANDKTSWQAYELYRDDLFSGMLVCPIRRDTTETEKKGKLVKTLKLRGLDRDCVYKVHDLDDKDGTKDYTAKGSSLMAKGIRCEGEPETVRTFIFTKEE